MSTAPTPQPQPEVSTAPAAAAVSNRTTKPKGVIPKNLQSWAWIAVLMVLAVGIFFSGTGPKKVAAGNGAAQSPTTPAAPSGLTPDQVSKRLQDSEATARLTTPPGGLPQGPPSQQTLAADPRLNPEAAFLNANQPPPVTTSPDPVDPEERKHDYLSRFASNIALSYRPGSHAENPSTPPAASATDFSDISKQLSGLPADLQQQLQAIQTQQQLIAAAQQQLTTPTSATVLPGIAAVPGTPATPATASAPAAAARKVTTSNNSSNGKNHIIFEGTLLETVLVNRLNGDFAGPVVCQVTTDLYSHDHSTLLIPAGTRALGETRKVDSLGQTRLAVVFHRLVMPDGYAVDLDQAPALNQIGETALNDKVNNHYFKIFGASIAVGALAGLSTIGTNNSATTGLPVSTSDAYREGVASSLSQSSLRILDKFLNIPPTITIREGHRVRIFLTQDLEVPAYANHTMPSNL
jgi:type IV secretory pathway VirB10-like protein